MQHTDVINISNQRGKKYDYFECQDLENEVNGKTLLVINKVFSEMECDNLINISEKKGYEQAGLYTNTIKGNVIDTYVRNSDRCIIDDVTFAKILEKRLDCHIPKIYKGKKFVNVNHRFRFLKYDGSGHFIRHVDGQYSDKHSQSMITVLIYLNKEYKSGFTTIFPDEYSDGFSIIPDIGLVCLMDQTISHEVPELVSGIKYVIRTELMYQL